MPDPSVEKIWSQCPVLGSIFSKVSASEKTPLRIAGHVLYGFPLPTLSEDRDMELEALNARIGDDYCELVF